MPKGIVRRELTINLPPSYDMIRVFELVSEELKVPQAIVRIESGRKLRLILVGTEAQVKEAWLRVKNLVNRLWDLYRLSRTGEASIDTIVKEAGRTFPPEALVYSLKIAGYTAEYDKDRGVIKSNAPAELVIKHAKAIAETIDQLKYLVKGTAIKKLIAALVVGLNTTIETVLEYGLKSGVMDRTDEGKYVLKVEWRQALRKLVVLISKGKRTLGE